MNLIKKATSKGKYIILILGLGLLGLISVSVVLNTGALAKVLSQTYLKENDLGCYAEKHSETASKIWTVRESYLSLLTDVEANIIDINSTIARRDILQTELSIIYKNASRTTKVAYKRAQDALKVSEELTFSDNEINHLLPGPLRVTKEKHDECK